MAVEPVIIGDATLYCGDCLEILPTLPKVDAVVTDPPFNFSTSSSGNKHEPWADIVNSAFWFSAILKAEIDRINVSGGFIWQFLNWRTITTIQKAAANLDVKIESVLVWDKCWIGTGGSRGLRPSYELCALFCIGDVALPNRGLSDIWRHPTSSKKQTGHPAEKPVPLLNQIVKETPSNLILDPFMGSGTTGIACINNKRKFIGIELEPRYFDIACRRIEAAQSQGRMELENAA